MPIFLLSQRYVGLTLLFVMVFAPFLMVRVALAEDTKVRRMLSYAYKSTPALADNFTHFPWVNLEAPKGGEITLGASGSYDSFNPYISKGDPAPGLGLISQGFMSGNPDELQSFYVSMAEWIEVAEDSSFVRFKIRDEARWHDGVPVSADDVVFSINILRTQGAPIYRRYFIAIGEVVAEGPKTVRVMISDSNNSEAITSTFSLPILPKHYWKDRDFTATTLEPPPGNGAYRIAKFDPGKSITYERVRGWWGQNLNVNRGLANFDRITYDLYRDSTVMLEAFKAGDIDFRSENVAKNWANSYDIPEVKDGRIIKHVFEYEEAGGISGFFMNSRRPPFDSILVREALSEMYDFEWANKTLFYDSYVRIRSYFPGALQARGIPEGEELAYLERWRNELPERVFTQEYTPPVSNGSGRDRRRRARALKLLSEAGWTLRNGQLVDASGKHMQIELFLPAGGGTLHAYEPFKRWLARIGIEMTIRLVESNVYYERLRVFDYDMTVLGFRRYFTPGNEQRDLWSSAAAQEDGSNNIMGISSPAIDEMIEELVRSPDRKSLNMRAQALDRALQWGFYLIPSWTSHGSRTAWWSTFAHPDISPRYSAPPIMSWWAKSG